METGEGIICFVIQDKADTVILDLIQFREEGVSTNAELQVSVQTKNILVFVFLVEEVAMVTLRIKLDVVSARTSRLDASFEGVTVVLNKLLE